MDRLAWPAFWEGGVGEKQGLPQGSAGLGRGGQAGGGTQWYPRWGPGWPTQLYRQGVQLPFLQEDAAWPGQDTRPVGLPALGSDSLHARHSRSRVGLPPVQESTYGNPLGLVNSHFGCPHLPGPQRCAPSTLLQGSEPG